MSIRINALRNVGAVLETAKILVKGNGLLGLALLPFCHIGYVNQQDKKVKNDYRFEHVVSDGSQLPPGIIVTRELQDDQLQSKYLIRNKIGVIGLQLFILTLLDQHH